MRFDRDGSVENDLRPDADREDVRPVLGRNPVEVGAVFEAGSCPRHLRSAEDAADALNRGAARYGGCSMECRG